MIRISQVYPALRLAATLLAFSTLVATAHAQNNLDPKDIPNPDPEIERQSFQVAEGFEVNLFASDPLLAKPIQMNFDPQGRLWVASSEVYPQIKPGEVANDKVIVLTDADGDGVAEKTSVFADGLLIPTGLEPGDGGVYVANSTELVHFRDLDGDGKADERRVVLSGFGTEDTHHILHTLRWGPEGLLYFNQSIYIHSHIETPHGVRRLNAGGIWMFRPETMRLEVFARGWVNSWGHAFDRWGQSFATDGAGGEGINYVLPGGSYTTAANAPRLVKGLNPGSPKDCGAEILSGRHLPEDWRGNILTNDFRGNRVCRYILGDDGAGFTAREQTELIKTKHSAFRPIDIKVGPDGAIYIADWYNPIIQHGEVDFRDPRRDHTRGRIWRVTAKGRPLVKAPRFARNNLFRGNTSLKELLYALTLPEDWTRTQAKRFLKELGAKEVEPALASWTKVIDKADEHLKLEALWTYQTIDVVEPALLETLLNAEDPRVRAAAVRVVSHWHDRLGDPLALLASRVVDDHPRVRLEAVRALAEIPSARSVEIALRALDKPMDQYLDYAVWLTARQLKDRWLPDVQAGKDDLGGGSHLAFALKAVDSPALVGPLLEMLKAGKVAAGQEEGAISLIASLGKPEDLGVVLDMAFDEKAPASRRAGLLAALARASAPRKVVPSGDLSRLGGLLSGGDEALRAEAARAVGTWKVEPLRSSLIELAGATDTAEPVRRAALDALANLGGPASLEALGKLAAEGRPLAERRLAVVALASLDPKAAAAKAIDVLSGEGDPAEVYQGFLRRKDGPSALAEALAGKTLPPDAAKLGIRAVRNTGRDAPALLDALTTAGKLDSGPLELTDAQRDQLVAEVRAKGDPARGEAVFRRKDQACLRCHCVAGAGGQVGPDLVSIGASAPVDYLVDSILLPNKAVKEGYHSLIVATDDGRIVQGIKVRQTDTDLVLRDADANDLSVPLSAIDDQKPGGSLMPAGLADPLTRAELVDLVRFLSELGKVGGDYAVGKARLVRRWRVLQPGGEAESLLNQPEGKLSNADDPRLQWLPAYSRVAGSLPASDLPKLGAQGPAVARFQVEVTTPGRIALALDPAAVQKIWVDDRPLKPSAEVFLDLGPGIHAITLAVDPSSLKDGLRCELRDVAGSQASAQVVVGR